MSRPAAVALAVAAILAAAVYLTGAAGTMWVRTACKALPVLALAVWTGRGGGAVTLGLVASAAGDALLDMGAFLPGMGAFALAHAFYLAAFARAESRLRPWQALPFAVWGVLAYIAIAPSLGAMALPVALYVAVISLMMWRAAAQAWPPARGLAWLGLAGAVLFGASDTLIALARWLPGFPAVGLAIMPLYWAGQALIAGWSVTATVPSVPEAAPSR